MKTSVILSTYNSVEWLEKVLWGFSAQTITDFDIVIADDGSNVETKEKIDALKKDINIPIIHVWHPDKGFQKTKILNKAILAAQSDYLIFTDGDCIPRNDFVERHLEFREKGFFLSGGYFKLPMNISKLISKNDILNQNCFDLEWLNSVGLTSSIKKIKLSKSHFLTKILNLLTPTKPNWNGHNASGFISEIFAINGFDELLDFGSKDLELGERLFKLGLLSIQILYSDICLHLDHDRGY